MDTLYPIDASPPPLVSNRYKFVEQLYVSPPYRRTMVSTYRDTEHNNALVVVKSIPDTQKTHEELKTLAAIEQMQNPAFVHIHGYFLSEDPLVQMPLLDTQESHLYFNIMMDYVPFTYKDLQITSYDTIAMIMVDLLYAIWMARQCGQFYHGDLNVGNIMFKQEETPRVYHVDGFTLTVPFPWMPVLIDFEKAIVGPSPRRENYSDVRNLMTAMRAMAEGLSETPAFTELYDEVVNFSFKDTRMTPEVISKLLTTHAFFANLRQVEREPKRQKCIECGLLDAKFMCSACGVLVCSERCHEECF